MLLRTRLSALTAGLLLSASALSHNGDKLDGPIAAEQVAKGIYMLTSQGGGNMAASVGSDGTFLVDDQFAKLSTALQSALKHVGGTSPKFLVNTHWHGDHTGGNEALGKTGTVIVAHENVRQRLSTDQFVKAFNMKSGPQPKAALPVVTFSESVTLHYNEDDIRVIHTADAHTDSDSFVHFTKANVIHAGDLYFSNMYPFIDPDSQGNIGGVIDAVSTIIEIANDDTVIIPGHGAVSNKAELIEYRDMLKIAEKRISKLKNKGKSLEDTVAAKPTKDLDEKWGKGFLNADTWVGIVYQGLK